MDLEQIKKLASEEIQKAKDLKSLEKIRLKYLSRKGQLTEILRSLKDRPLVQRRKIGPLANALKKELQNSIEEKIKKIKEVSLNSRKLDLTRPAPKIIHGHLHPLTIIKEEISKIFLSMNFSIADGPEIENEYYNFDALNIPPNHPARDMWDTFWLSKNLKSKILDSKLAKTKFLLRTHTSPVQIRYMETHQPPFQIIVPGRVFRYEATDASHEINFYQVEGLMVGPDISLANFKFVVEEFFKKFFGPAGQRIEFRFRPSYFPFTEPSLEVDVKITDQGRRAENKSGQFHPQSAASQPQSGWLEVMGAGMVHRKVFDAVRYNPDEVQGFAFGLGLERLAMLKYKIPDIRLFYAGDLRFIRQF